MDSVLDLPHTITFAILYRKRIDSFNELPKDKRPPRNLWDKPFALNQFLDKIWDKEGGKKEKEQYYVYDDEDVD